MGSEGLPPPPPPTPNRALGVVLPNNPYRILQLSYEGNNLIRRSSVGRMTMWNDEQTGFTLHTIYPTTPTIIMDDEGNGLLRDFNLGEEGGGSLRLDSLEKRVWSVDVDKKMVGICIYKLQFRRGLDKVKVTGKDNEVLLLGEEEEWKDVKPQRYYGVRFRGRVDLHRDGQGQSSPPYDSEVILQVSPPIPAVIKEVTKMGRKMGEFVVDGEKNNGIEAESQRLRNLADEKEREVDRSESDGNPYPSPHLDHDNGNGADEIIDAGEGGGPSNEQEEEVTPPPTPSSNDQHCSPSQENQEVSEEEDEEDDLEELFSNDLLFIKKIKGAFNKKKPADVVEPPPKRPRLIRKLPKSVRENEMEITDRRIRPLGVEYLVMFKGRYEGYHAWILGEEFKTKWPIQQYKEKRRGIAQGLWEKMK